jgi:hypothetical protein
VKFNININQKALHEIAPELNVNHASLLDFCIHFINAKSPKIQRYTVNGEVYTYVAPKLIIREMPLLKITNARVMRRLLQILESSGFLKSSLIKNHRLVFKLTEKVDLLSFSEMDFDIDEDKKNIKSEAKGRGDVLLSKSPPVLKSTPIIIIKNNNINKSIDKEKTKNEKSSKPIEKTETLFDERLVFLKNEFKGFKCSFPSLSAIVKQAKKFFKLETDEEIITALIDYWKKYKPNRIWNSGAWFYSEFLPQAYELYHSKKESAKLENEQMKSNAAQRMKSDEQQKLQYQKDLELQKVAMDKFYSLQKGPQLNIISKFNNEHKSKVGISIKNKIIT